MSSPFMTAHAQTERETERWREMEIELAAGRVSGWDLKTASRNLLNILKYLWAINTWAIPSSIRVLILPFFPGACRAEQLCSLQLKAETPKDSMRKIYESAWLSDSLTAIGWYMNCCGHFKVIYYSFRPQDKLFSYPRYGLWCVLVAFSALALFSAPSSQFSIRSALLSVFHFQFSVH